MNIMGCLKQENVRVSYGNRWLIWDEEWRVYEHRPYAKSIRCLAATQSEPQAVKALLEGNSEDQE